MMKRELIFDSMCRVFSRQYGKAGSKVSSLSESRGTYLFSFGAGFHGQLGRKFERGKRKYDTIPKLIHLDVAIRQIACGELHTAAVTDSGQVYTWGDARSHQLGYQPHGFTNQPTPRLVDALDGAAFITQVACGQAHTVALSDRGVLFSWGSSKSGQCGHGDRSFVRKPRAIRVDDLSTTSQDPGRPTSSEGGLMSPTKPVSTRFIDISCGDRHTAGVTASGHVFTWGCNQQGQLGLDQSASTVVSSDVSRPTLVASLVDKAISIASLTCGPIITCCLSSELLF